MPEKIVRRLLHIRWMIRADLIPGVLPIEEAQAVSQGRRPETEDSLLRYLRDRNIIGMIAACGDEIQGYMVYELCKGSLHLYRIAWRVDQPEIATALLNKLLEKLLSHRRKFVSMQWNGLRLTLFHTRDVQPLFVLPDEYKTSDALALCRGETHPYLPILADALQDAGCNNRWLLESLRTPDYGEGVYAMLAEQLR